MTPIKTDRQLEVYLSELEKKLKKQSKITRIKVNIDRDLSQDLIYDKTIVIKPVDEGNVVVIWDKEDYLKDSKNHMNDNIVYGEVTGNPLEALKQKMKNVLKKK